MHKSNLLAEYNLPSKKTFDVFEGQNLPEGKKTSLYSPSTVILEYLKPGDSLKISDFKSLAIQALHKASEKVRAKYGFACTRTLEEEEKILSWISNYDPDQLISISKE